MNDPILPLNAAPAPHAARQPAGLPQPWLVADIGGTNARFGWVDGAAGTVHHVRTLAVAEHAGPAQAAQAYLADLAQHLGSHYRPPAAAAFAVATAVGQDRVAFTNSGWTFSRSATQSALQLQELLLLNDFEALALSLPRLGASQVREIGPDPRRAAVEHAGAQPGGGSLAVVGPGTGLGVAGLVRTHRGWVAIPGEGGHATLAAADKFEAALLAAARQQHAHVSAERLLSGIGLPVLHAATAQVLGQPAAATLTSSEIVEAALAGHDAVCSRTVDSFCALLGSFAGNVALTLGARGGVYIGGGIVPRLGEHFFQSRFRERFEAKGRFAGYLQAVPTLLITDTLAALGGAALALEQHGA